MPFQKQGRLLRVAKTEVIRLVSSVIHRQISEFEECVNITTSTQ